MTATRERLIQPPSPTWHLASVPPPDRRHFVYKLTGGKLGLSTPGMGVAEGIDEAAMSVPAVVTTPRIDRVGDSVTPEGCEVDEYRLNSPVFFGHQLFPFPVGSATDPKTGILHVNVEPGRRVLSRCFFIQNGEWAKTALDIFVMVRDKALKGVSVGFNPNPDYVTPLPTGGNRYDKWKMLEWSFCGLGMNPECVALVTEYLSRDYIAERGKAIHPVVRKSLEAIAEPTPAWSSGWTPQMKDMATTRTDLAADLSARLSSVAKAHAAGAWNRSLGADFAVESMPSRPANVVYQWVSRHVGCAVKKLSAMGHGVPSARMGSFLTGLKHALAGHDLKDVRNLTHNGTETPPAYQTIQLNSKSCDDFLINGMAFHAGPAGKFVLEYEPTFFGLQVTAYAEQANKQLCVGLLKQAEEWAKANNFLKGEAFSLSGEFLDRTDEDWPDVILEEKNKEPLARTLKLLNEQGKQFPARGIIMSGPPGTGKTLSSRIIRNQAKASFIWVSARDFHYSGGFGGVALGFEMAKELAPSVLVFEDIDNWLGEKTIDLIKTEMDGISRSSGVLTVLTTNFPERLPSALIDRPGRFHDVLRFDLPTPSARRAMLAKWLPGLPSTDIEQAVSRTQGYSGAHVYELAHFAKSLRDHEGKALPDALREALAKVEEQRELITQLQLTGSHYRPRKEVQAAMSKKWRKSGKPKVDKGACAPCEATKQLVAAVPKEARDALQACVSAKIPKIAEDHPEMSHEQRIAVAFSMCGEDDKALAESDGAAGGYAVPANGKDDEEPYGQDTPGAPAKPLAKAMPPAQPAPGAMPPDPNDPLAQQPPTPAAPPATGNPREVISAFMSASSAMVDAAALLFDLVNGTGEQATPPGVPPGTPPGAAPTELDDDEFDLGGDLDLDDDGETEEGDEETDDGAPNDSTATPSGAGESPDEDSEEEADDEDDDELKDRYRLRDGKPAVAKGGAAGGGTMRLSKKHRGMIHKAALHCKAMAEVEKPEDFTDMYKAMCLLHHKNLMGMCKMLDGAGDDDGEEEEVPQAPASEPATESPPAAEEKLDVAAILKRMESVDSRIGGIEQSWQNLNGAVPN